MIPEVRSISIARSCKKALRNESIAKVLAATQLLASVGGNGLFLFWVIMLSC